MPIPDQVYSGDDLRDDWDGTQYDGPRCRYCGEPCDDFCCEKCQQGIYATCPGGGVDDLCSGDPNECGLCVGW